MGQIRLTVMTGAAAFTLLCSGCEQKPSRSTAAKSTKAVATQPTATELANVRELIQEDVAQSPSALPPGHPPIAGGQTPLPPSTGPAAGAAEAPLQFTPPETWSQEPVSSGMRLAQYRLPRAESDTEDGELAVFGASIRGTVDQNIERWRGQFSTAEGQPVPDGAFARETFEADGMKVTLISVTGRYNAGTMMGGSAAPKDNFTMLGAIVETPSGLCYFKAVGPQATMTRHQDALLHMLRTVKKE